eukprot:TRINITY_DN12382_c0_g1_i1.p1 TRINITY_DN12382_c0_g1~~TRINITY_DN12382_c0_g1_i1.p1  ORF type:complete len:254 (+),score=53.01 TRINITY_DN12382_c0_g1_i1:79-840(+)
MTTKITNETTGTNITEIASGIYRISTPVAPNAGLPAGFTFNQFLIVDEKPLLFHTGMRRLFPVVKEAIESVMPVSKLRYVAFSHHEVDENGALEQFLDAAPDAQPVASGVSVMVNLGDVTDRECVGMNDNDELDLGPDHKMRWLFTPHLPHGWETGYMFETKTKTLLCGDILTQVGDKNPAIDTDADAIMSRLFPLESQMQAVTADTGKQLQRMADLAPATLAIMHGSSFTGNCASLLMRYADKCSQFALSAR